MSTALPYFPTSFLKEERHGFDIVNQVVFGSASGSGRAPRTRTDGGGLWRAELQSIPLWTEDMRRTWRALSGRAEGGVQPFIVPMHDMIDGPFPLDGNGNPIYANAEILHDEDVPFEGEVGYFGAVIDATLVNAASERATTVRIAVGYGEDLRGGEYFSLDDIEWRWRLHKIVHVEALDVVSPDRAYFDCQIRPPLRTGYAAGTQLEFDNPRCVMALANPQSMDAMFEGYWFGRPSASLLEFMPPFPP